MSNTAPSPEDSTPSPEPENSAAELSCDFGKATFTNSLPRRKKPPPLICIESPRCVTDLPESPSPAVPKPLPLSPSRNAPPVPEFYATQGREGEYWSVTKTGTRRFQCEDVALNRTDGPGPWSVYGVFDGHGGKQAAEFAADHFPANLRQAAGPLVDSQDALTAAFLETDAQFSRTSYDSVGATAVVALLKPGSMLVGHVGDSKAVISSRNGVASELTEDHRATRESEADRVEQAGGFVLMKRVQGVLAISRSIGDRKYKPFISAKPDLLERSVTREDEFLILASDGLWDVISAQEAVDITRKCKGGLEIAAQQLAARAQSCGSTDDVTVLIVSLTQFHPLTRGRTPKTPKCVIDNPTYCSWDPSQGDSTVLAELSDHS